MKRHVTRFQRSGPAAAAPGWRVFGWSVGVLLVVGVAGCEQFVDQPPPARRTPPGVGATPLPPEATFDVGLRDEVNAIEDRLDVIEDQLKELVDTPGTARPEVRALQTRVEEISTAQSQVAPLPDKLEELEDRFAELTRALDELRDEVRTLRRRQLALDDLEGDVRTTEDEIPESDETVETPIEAGVDVVGLALAPAIEMFQDRRYQDALRALQSLQETNPNDARVWYLSALVRGFATQEWRGDTERLVRRGMELERNDSPERNQIDETFDFLTRATGQEWLEAYRQRASPR